MDSRFIPDIAPVAVDHAVISGDRWRITVLTDGLLRLEWSEDGGFEDRASTFAVRRALPVPAFRVVDGDDVLEVISERLHLTYDRGPFSSTGLTVQARGAVSSWHSRWRYGDAPADLGGTARTLDMADGRVPLGAGVIARGGVAVLDDSASFLLTDDGWIASRAPGRLDLYVFAYGHDYDAALSALSAVSGLPPLLPRWTLGNWWSRYHPYTADEYLALLDRFDAEDVRFSVAVLDMDWHRVASVPPRYGSGWTGYSWERTLFPDPPAFLAELHRRGLRTTLNVHPADGVRGFEDAYRAMCVALGRDPGTDDPIAFDPTDQAFLTAYFDVLHHPLEAEGVDFWWLDWQQGSSSRLPGVDPLWVLNHYHFLDSGRDGRRPLTFSRYAGPGSHRTPVGFSGDTLITWASLDFQPEFTATAANIGYGWWSHDIGGHLYGARDDELTARWVQLGVFSPILRLHSSNNPFLTKEPWSFPAEARAAIDGALRLRTRLVPYLHTMNHRAAADGVSLVAPMYHLAPEVEAAYSVPNEFAFGSELVVAPITTPRDPVTLRGAARAWLPPGLWIDIVTGEVQQGGRTAVLHRDGSSIPVLLKAGGILPLAPENAAADANPTALEVLVAPGADGEFVLVEDDGSGSSVADARIARTPVRWQQESGRLTIGPVEGADGAVPASRSWTVRLLGVETAPVVVEATGREAVTADTVPDPRPRTLGRQARLFGLLDAAQFPYEAKARIWAAVGGDEPAAAQLSALDALGLPDGLRSALTELIVAV